MSEQDAVIAEANRRFPSNGSIHDTSGRDRKAFIDGAIFGMEQVRADFQKFLEGLTQ